MGYTAHMPLRVYKTGLDSLYDRYTRREFVHPDPLEFLYDYPDPGDREVVGLLAASLAYGRVSHILKSVRTVLDRLGPSPARTVHTATARELRERLAGVKHRFTDGAELAALLAAAAAIVREHGSLGTCLASHVQAEHATITPALTALVAALHAAGAPRTHLLPDPAAGSACKRLHLYLRWMIRRDAVDPGGWTGVSPRLLMVPVDVHMHRMARALGATRRSAADGRTAEEVSAAFRSICPQDPARYDFALTRLGIRERSDPNDLPARLQSD